MSNGENITPQEIRGALINIVHLVGTKAVYQKPMMGIEEWSEHQRIVIAIYVDALATIALGTSGNEDFSNLDGLVGELLQFFPEVEMYHINAGRYLVQDQGDEKGVKVAKVASSTLQNLNKPEKIENSLADLLKDKTLEWDLEALETFFATDGRSYTQPRYEKPALIWGILFLIAGWFIGTSQNFYAGGLAVTILGIICLIYWYNAQKKRRAFEKN